MRLATAVLAAIVGFVLAGCNDDDEDTTPQVRLTPEGELRQTTGSLKQEVEQIGNTWASLYVAGPNPDACADYDRTDPYREIPAKYMAQPACEQMNCVSIKNCTPPDSGFQQSFSGATVEDVAIKGKRAAAKFSNGELIVFVHHPVVQPEDELAPRWLIVRLGGDAAAFFD